MFFFLLFQFLPDPPDLLTNPTLFFLLKNIAKRNTHILPPSKKTRNQNSKQEREIRQKYPKPTGLMHSWTDRNRDSVQSLHRLKSDGIPASTRSSGTGSRAPTPTLSPPVEALFCSVGD